MPSYSLTRMAALSCRISYRFYFFDVLLIIFSKMHFANESHNQSISLVVRRISSSYIRLTRPLEFHRISSLILILNSLYDLAPIPVTF